MKRTVLVFAWVAVVLVPAGCLGPPSDIETFRATGRPILFGSADTSPDHMAVVALTIGTDYFCSGTLITSDVVLTAAHCIAGMSESSTRVYFGQKPDSGAGDFRQISAWRAHRSYGESGSMEGDIAIIRLTAPAPAAVAPIPYLPTLRGLTQSDAGRTINFSGFGLTEDNTDGVKLQVDGTIESVCPGPDQCGELVAPKAFGYSQTLGGPCYGDSGGPAFIDRDRTEYLAGITSYGDKDCSVYGVSTTVSEYTSWIETFLTTGGNEDCTNGRDDDSDGVVDCDDGDCLVYPACLPPNACNAPTRISCGASVDDNTADGSSVFSQNACAQDATSVWGGPERVYQVDADAGTQVTAQLQIRGSGDLDLFVLSDISGSCDLNSCIDVSANSETTPESVSFSMPATPRFLMVDTWDTPSAYTITVDCGGVIADEDCTNGIDDDNDGAVDCNDGDCVATSSCPSLELCNNHVDDDGDGAIDCADPDCARACNSGSSPVATGGGCSTTGPTTSAWPHTLALIGLPAVRRRRARTRRTRARRSTERAVELCRVVDEHVRPQ